MHFTELYPLCHLCAKNFHSWWKFDSYDKIILHSFLKTRCIEEEEDPT